MRWRALRRVARATGSDALAADALHFSSDLVASAAGAGRPRGDPRRLCRTPTRWPRSASRCSSASPASGSAGAPSTRWSTPRRRGSREVAAPRGRSTCRASPAIDYIRLRRSGAQSGRRARPVRLAHPAARTRRGDQGRRRGGDRTRSWPNVEVTLTANPLALDDETLLERMLLIASRRRLFVHHVGVQNVGGRKSRHARPRSRRRGCARRRPRDRQPARSGDRRRARRARSRSRPISSRWRRANSAASRPTPTWSSASRRRCRRPRRAAARLREVHDVRVRAAPAGYYVIFHCRADPDAHRRGDPRSRSTRWSARCAPSFPTSSASSATPNRRAEARRTRSAISARARIAPARKAFMFARSTRLLDSPPWTLTTTPPTCAARTSSWSATRRAARANRRSRSISRWRC